jgi:enoyl-CoA hydratase/carnithine racemase
LPETFKDRSAIDAVFGLDSVASMEAALAEMDTPWAAHTLKVLQSRSPLMLHVVLEQIRKARTMTLAEDLRMERDMVYQCFNWRSGTESETVEGIRALAVDKDHQPKWNPPLISGVTPGMVAQFFKSPWAPDMHPLAHLS